MILFSMYMHNRSFLISRGFNFTSATSSNPNAIEVDLKNKTYRCVSTSKHYMIFLTEEIFNQLVLLASLGLNEEEVFNTVRESYDDPL